MAYDWMNQKANQAEISEAIVDDVDRDPNGLRLEYDEKEWDNLSYIDYKLPRSLNDFDQVYEKELKQEYEENLNYIMTFNDEQEEEKPNRFNNDDQSEPQSLNSEEMDM